MKISQRLKAIAHLAENSFRVLDVGSDHGYLPYLLLKNSEVVKVIVADISNESLLKAKGNLETFFDSKTIEAIDAVNEDNSTGSGFTPVFEPSAY